MNFYASSSNNIAHNRMRKSLRVSRIHYICPRVKCFSIDRLHTLGNVVDKMRLESINMFFKYFIQHNNMYNMT